MSYLDTIRKLEKAPPETGAGRFVQKSTYEIYEIYEKSPVSPLTRPANWREVLAALGYQVKGHRATCPLCTSGKTGLAVSVTAWGVNCFRSRSHCRSWADILSVSVVPAKPGTPAVARHRVAMAEQERVRRMLAREAAAFEWTCAPDASADHPYLVRKHLAPMGARVDAAGNLLVPVYGPGRMGIEILFSLERIAPDGEKKFEARCRVKGGYCFVRPDWEQVHRAQRLGPIPGPRPQRVWLAEGFATAATVALATGETACCVFSAGNLVPVLESLTRRMRGTEFIIAADNDRETPGNPGLCAAREATRRFGLRIALPEFPPGVAGSDWNDLAAALDSGTDEVSPTGKAPVRARGMRRRS